MTKKSIIKRAYFCIFFLLLMGIRADASECNTKRISSIIQEYKSSLFCTEKDTPWFICHYLLAFGEDSTVLTSNGQMRAIPYLVFQAHHENGSLFFAKQSDDSLQPFTSPFPIKRYQDHRNQFLAVFAEISNTANTAQPPQGIQNELWHQMLIGAWNNYNLKEDPSWILLFYVNCFQMLPAEPQDVASRICSILEILTDPNSDIPLACDGTHALRAMAVYLKSACSDLIPQKLNDRVRHKLELALANIATNNNDSKKNGIFGVKYLTPFERDMLTIDRYGHNLEWLVEFLPLSNLKSDKIHDIVKYLCCSLERCQNMRLKDYGGVSHSIHALQLYVERTKGCTK